MVKLNKRLQNIIRQAIDIHLHVGPEIIPRKYTVPHLLKSEIGKLGGAVLKNHFYPTQPFINESRGIKLFGGIVLNNSVGGMNPESIYASSLLTDKPFMVWFPTINAKNFLDKSEYEIAPEWVKNKDLPARKSTSVNPVLITNNNKLRTEVIQVLKAIKKFNAILATGHIAWKESVLVIREAKKIGINNIVVTHPIYQRIAMPIEAQKELTSKGVFVEQSYSMYSIDKIPIEEIAKQIRYIGVESVILSSDMGQAYSPSSSKALLIFAKLLSKQGIRENEIFTMMVTNPKKLLSID